MKRRDKQDLEEDKRAEENRPYNPKWDDEKPKKKKVDVE